MMLLMLWQRSHHVNWPEEKENNLNPTEQREPGEESHGASNKTQLTLKLDLRVSFYLVVGSGVKEDMDKLNGRIRYVLYVRYGCWVAKSNIPHESPLVAQISLFDFLELLTLSHIMFGHISVQPLTRNLASKIFARQVINAESAFWRTKWPLLEILSLLYRLLASINLIIEF